MGGNVPVEKRVVPWTGIRRERLLPARGEVLVNAGDRVEPEDLVARCQVPGKLWVLDLSQALGVRREQAGRYMCKGIGATVRAYEVLARRPRGLGRQERSCLSPVDGCLLAVRAGRVLIDAAATTLELKARMRGRITDVVPGRGVIIDTAGAWLQGVWGTGGEANGTLRLAVKNNREPLRAESLDADHQGALVVAGRISDERALDRAAELGVLGMISGSVDAQLCRFLQLLPYPVMITAGFGQIAMSPQAFSLLQSWAGREAMLDARTPEAGVLSGRLARPEVLIPLEMEDRPPALERSEGAAEAPGPHPLQAGMAVRGLRSPYLGAVGTVTDLPAGLQRMETGVELPVATVQLDTGEFVTIPLANLEVLC